MKALTAANKLSIHLPAAPEEFRNATFTRDEVDELRDNPPAWLTELRRTGPFPRDVVAQKLGISRAGLGRGDTAENLTSDEIGVLLADPPPWLLKERRTYDEVVAEKARLKYEQP